jgi:hypothetical protein
LHIFALSVTTSLKIPGAVIPRRVFTRPGSQTELPFLNCDVRFTPDSDHQQAGGIGSFVPKAEVTEVHSITVSASSSMD